MATALLDDPEFLAELEELDVRFQRGNREFAHQPTIEEWAEEHGSQAPEPEWVGDPLIVESAPQPLTAVMFVGLMFVGAGAAALVFHQRVLQILSTR